MCGIAGYLQLDGAPAADLALLRRMNDALAHRGPDDEGYLVDGPVALGMRRLSIIDLATGEQPIHNEDKTVWVVFNGEIYNYRDLAAELRAKGHAFYTSSDTETIVHLYEEHGHDFVARLRGMFALALWDRARQVLILARDRLGVKPLYYGVRAGRMAFGSELKALLADPRTARAIDGRGLAAYLRYGYVPDPLTILTGIRKLPPGHLLVARRGRVEIKAYWDVLPFFDGEGRPGSEAECKAQVAELLREAVRLRLVSDVPVGAFLSGGIDSSMVVAMMTRALDHPVKTFTVGFEEEAFSELPYAREVARRLGTDHHELVLRPESLDILDRIVWHFDEPFGDPSALPTYFVSRLARDSVKVVLSGDGGDEVFGGYDRYLEHLRRTTADRIPDLAKRGVLRPLSVLLPDGTPGKRLLYNLSLPPTERYLGSISYFSPPLLRRLLHPELHPALDGDLLAPLDGLSPAPPLSRIQALDFRTYLPGDILVKVDRMSMAHSIEAREPLLDHKLVEYMAGLNPALKIRGGTSKYLFKQIASDYLPARIVFRRKQGFAVPLRHWFKDSLIDHVHEILGEPRTRQRGYFDPTYLAALRDRFARAPRQYTHRLWLLLIFETWCRLYLDVPAVATSPPPPRVDAPVPAGSPPTRDLP